MCQLFASRLQALRFLRYLRPTYATVGCFPFLAYKYQRTAARMVFVRFIAGMSFNTVFEVGSYIPELWCSSANLIVMLLRSSIIGIGDACSSARPPRIEGFVPRLIY